MVAVASLPAAGGTMRGFSAYRHEPRSLSIEPPSLLTMTAMHVNCRLTLFSVTADHGIIAAERAWLRASTFGLVGI